MAFAKLQLMRKNILFCTSLINSFNINIPFANQLTSLYRNGAMVLNGIGVIYLVRTQNCSKN